MVIMLKGLFKLVPLDVSLHQSAFLLLDIWQSTSPTNSYITLTKGSEDI